MDEKPRKKRKSGHDFKKYKEARQREEAATSCAKITSFCIPRAETTSLPFQDDAVDASCSTAQFVKSRPTETSTTDIENGQGTSRSALDFFIKPKPTQLDLFFSFHPNQPNPGDIAVELPFKCSAYEVTHEDGNNFKRNWLSFNENNNKLYCSVCLAFTDGSSVFCKGFDNFRHINQILGEHEKSKTHLESVRNLISLKHGKTIDKMLFEKQLDKRKKEVLQKRHVVSCAIDVIKLIGKQGIAFRGKIESAHTLDDLTINHGNFLEILLLLSEYDNVLSSHIKRITQDALEKRDKQQEVGSTSKGRGSNITFLSKSTVGKIITIIKDIIRQEIASEVIKAKQFSILMDTTMDVSQYDQCAIVVRYVYEGEVKERMLSLKNVNSTTGKSLFESLMDCLRNAGLSVENCIANAFDGASNMCGQYKGVSTRLKEIVPNHIHTWCYSHSLNLVISDTCQCLTEAISFFGLINEVQVFFKESFKRLSVYEKQCPKLKLTAIGATRWRSRSDATCKIFGSYNLWYNDDGDNEAMNENINHPTSKSLVFVELVLALSEIGNSSEFNPTVRNTANSILNKLLAFETVIVAMMFLMVFKITTPLSDYLQTKNLDYAQAWTLVSVAQRQLQELRSSFSKVFAAAVKFASTMNSSIEEKLEEDPDSDVTISVKTELSKRRFRKKKKMTGEMLEDERVADTEEEQFRIKVYNVVIDQINESMRSRFSDHKNLFLDLSCFSPLRFKEIRKDLPAKSLEKICSLIPNLDANRLIEELQSLAAVWPQFTSTMSDRYNEGETDQNETDQDETDQDETDPEAQDQVTKMCIKEEPCRSCIKCVYKLILEYNLYSVMYTELNKVYKFLLTIPLTQVSCERAFSHLKLIKTRLRSNLSNENLEAFLMMQMEKEVLMKIDNEKVIDCLCEQSQELERHLRV